VEVIRLAMEKLWLPPNSVIFDFIHLNGLKYARTIVKGKCRFRLGVEQRVTLDEEKC
jgi:hypothetical protein